MSPARSVGRGKPGGAAGVVRPARESTTRLTREGLVPAPPETP
jgi:hypothetical protein